MTDEVTTTELKPTRDTLRSKILGTSHKMKSRLIMFFGAQIEIRQPSLGAILDAQEKEDRQAAVIDYLLERTYVPGTDEKVFDDTDVETLRDLPFGEDFIRVTEAIQELSDVNFLDKPNTSVSTL